MSPLRGVASTDWLVDRSLVNAAGPDHRGHLLSGSAALSGLELKHLRPRCCPGQERLVLRPARRRGFLTRHPLHPAVNCCSVFSFVCFPVPLAKEFSQLPTRTLESSLALNPNPTPTGRRTSDRLFNRLSALSRLRAQDTSQRPKRAECHATADIH